MFYTNFIDLIQWISEQQQWQGQIDVDHIKDHIKDNDFSPNFFSNICHWGADLSRNQKGAMLLAIGTTRHKDQVKKINLSVNFKNSLSSNLDLRIINSFSKFPNLESINLQGCVLCDDWLVRLTQLAKVNPNLIDVYFDENLEWIDKYGDSYKFNKFSPQVITDLNNQLAENKKLKQADLPAAPIVHQYQAGQLDTKRKRNDSESDLSEPKLNDKKAKTIEPESDTPADRSCCFM